MTGSMLIPNDTGGQTILVLNDSGAIAQPTENALSFARAALKREKSNATVSSGNIKFLCEWIRVFENPPAPPVVNPPSPPLPPSPPKPVVNITPPSKTSVRILGEPWEKDPYLKTSGEKLDASTKLA